MKDPTTTNLSCQDAATNTTFTGPDDVWGNGNATNRETGCVDALFVAQTEVKMLAAWDGPQRHGRRRRRLADPDRPRTTRTRTTTAPRWRSGTTPPASGSARSTWSATRWATASTTTRRAASPATVPRSSSRTRSARRPSGTPTSRAVRHAGLHRRRADQPGRQRPDPVHVQPVARRARQLLLQQHPVARRSTRRPDRATTGSTCSPRAPTRPTASRPARPATARRSRAWASRPPRRSCTTRCC